MKRLIYFLCISIVLISCSGSDDSSDSNPNDGQPQSSETFIRATVNGNVFMASPNADGSQRVEAALAETGFQDIYLLNIVGVNLNSTTEGESVFLFLNGQDFSSVGSGFEYVDTEADDEELLIGFAGLYTDDVVDDGEGDYGYVENSGTFKITSINKTTQVISGEFNFTSTNNISGEVYTVTDGVFNNINYSISD